MITMGGFVIGSSIASGAILGPYFGGKAYNGKIGKERYGDTWDYYMKTQWNKPIRLPIYNNTIAVLTNTIWDIFMIKNMTLNMKFLLEHQIKPDY